MSSSHFFANSQASKPGRPAGEIRQALMQAARDVVVDLGQPNRGATLAEMAKLAGSKLPLGRDVARRYVDHMRRAGALRIVAERRVDYRNRPVAEYVPVDHGILHVEQGWVDLGHCMAGWVR